MSAANYAAIKALDIAIKEWLAVKYDLAGVDDDGQGVYNRPPEEWEEGDLDMVLAWNDWFSRKRHDQEDLLTWIKIADARGVDLRTLGKLKPEEETEWGFNLPTLGKVAAGLGGAAFVHWLLKPAMMPSIPQIKLEEQDKRDISTMSSPTAALRSPQDYASEGFSNVVDKPLTQAPERRKLLLPSGR